MRCGAWLVGVALVVLVHAHAHVRAQAQALPLELAWQAPVDCAQAADVRAELERIARVRPGFEQTRLVARAQVIHTGAGYSARLYTERDGREGERQLQAADCKTLVRSVTLVLALAFGPGVEVVADAQPSAQTGTPAAAARQTPSPSPPLPPAQAEPEPEPEPPQDTRAPSEQGPSFALQLGGGAQLGLLPSPAFSALAAFEVGFGALSIQLQAAWIASVVTEVRPDVEARFDALGGTLLGCGNLPHAELTLALCGGLRGAAIRGRSSGVSDDGSERAPWSALATAAALTWPSSQPVRVRLQAGAALSLGRPRFAIENVGEAHRVPWVTGELDLMLVLAL